MESASRTVKTRSFQERGRLHQEIIVEVLLTRGNQSIAMTGMAEASVRESLEKIRCLLKLRNCWHPSHQLMVNLLPPEVPKFGAHLELAIYAACLQAIKSADAESEDSFELQEPLAAALNLDGTLMHTQYSERLCHEQASLLGSENFRNLEEFEAFLFTPAPLRVVPRFFKPVATADIPIEDLEVDGLELERFWILAAAIQGNPLILIGPPGVGKSHLARWSHSLLPCLPDADRVSLVGLWKSTDLQLLHHRPLLNPHSRTRFSDFIGTSLQNRQRPGLYALADQGLLILDEFNELNRDCRELLRTVMDERRVLRHTRSGSIQWSANFWLILTANPCECGFANGRDLSRCRCSQNSLRHYQSRLSGPLMDRMAVRRFVSAPAFSQTKVAAKISDLVQQDGAALRTQVAACQEILTKATPRLPESLLQLLSERSRSQRELQLSCQLARSIYSLQIFSDSEIQKLFVDKFEHERQHFEGNH